MWGFDNNACQLLRHQQCPVPRSACVTTPRSSMKPCSSFKPADCPEVRPACVRFFDPGRSCSAPSRRRPCDVGIPDKRYCHISPGRPRSVNLEPTVKKIPLKTYIDQQHQSRSTKSGKKKTDKQLSKQPSKSKVRKKQIATKTKNPTKDVAKTSAISPQKSSPPSSSNKETAKTCPPVISQKSSVTPSTKEVEKTCSPVTSQKSSVSPSSVKEVEKTCSPIISQKSTDAPSAKEGEKSCAPIISQKSSLSPSSTKEVEKTCSPVTSQKSSVSPPSVKEVEKTCCPTISQKSSDSPSSTTEGEKTCSPIISQKSSLSPSSTKEVDKTCSPIISKKSSLSPSTKEVDKTCSPIISKKSSLSQSTTKEVEKTCSPIMSRKSSVTPSTNSKISEPTCDEKCESQKINQSVSEDDLKNDKINTSFVDNAEDHEYVHFLLRITEDILRNNMYTNSGMNEVFESHLEANRGRLSEEKMRGQIERLKKELNYPLKDKGQLLIESVCQCNDIKAYFKDCRCCPSDKTDSNTLEQDSCVCKNPECAGEDDKTIETEILSLFEKVKKQTCQCTEVEVAEDDGGKEDEVKKEQDIDKEEDVDKGDEAGEEDDENKECVVGEGDIGKDTDVDITEADVSKKDDVGSTQLKSSPSNIKNESSDGYPVEGSISTYLDVCDDECPQKITGEEPNITCKSKNKQGVKETLDGGLSKKNLDQCIDAPGCKNNNVNNLTLKFSEAKIEEEKVNKQQLSGPVCSKLNSSFKMIQKDENNMEKKMSQIAFYNTDVGEVCHCTITLRKTALKIESDEDNDQEYILVEGPVCMPKTLLEEKTIPVMIENLSSILEDSNSDIRADGDVISTSSRVNFLISERAAEEAPRQNHNFNPKSVSSHIINRGQTHDYDLTPERDFSSEGECLSAGKQECIFSINQGLPTTCASDCSALRKHMSQSKTSVITNKSEEKQEDEPVEELKQPSEEKPEEQQDKSDKQAEEQFVEKPKQSKEKLEQISEENVEEKPKKRVSSSTESSLDDVVSNKSKASVSKINLYACSQCDINKNIVTSHQLAREDIDDTELDAGLDPSEKCCCGAAAILMGPDYYVGDGDSKKSGISPSESSTTFDFQKKYHFLLQDVAVSCTSFQIHEADKLPLPVIIPTSVKEQLKQPSRSSKSKEPSSKKIKLKKASLHKIPPKAVISDVEPANIQTKSFSSVDDDSKDKDNNLIPAKERKISIDKYHSPRHSLEIHSTSSNPYGEELPRMFQYSSKGTKQESDILSGSLQSNETDSNISNTIRRPYWHNDGTEIENENSEDSIQDNVPESNEYPEEINEQLYREPSNLYHQPNIIVPPNEDEEDYDHKDIISKLDEIPQLDSLDKQLNNAHAVTNKLENFRKIDTKETEKRFQSYANTDNFEIRRQISSESDKKIEEYANQTKKQKNCCKIPKSKK